MFMANCSSIGVRGVRWTKFRRGKWSLKALGGGRSSGPRVMLEALLSQTWLGKLMHVAEPQYSSLPSVKWG